jgi:Concanavalin A-like lectin/glucanases superfamily/Bacterial Ig-like domain (group 2)/Abnormal spindle-like microcephaly-assoc'd, ASPM-SPD-2-Hydin
MRTSRIAKAHVAKAFVAIPVNHWSGRFRWLLVWAVVLCCGLGLRAQSLSLTSKDFGSVAIGFTNSVKITLTNSTTPLSIASITTTGDYSQTSTCPIAPQTLAANGTCIITAVFSPAALGALNGTLAVNDNASNSPQTAALTGTGLAPVVLSPSSLAMGNEALNTTSASKTITVKNNQPTPLTITSISTSGNFGQTSNCPLSPSTLAASTTCTVSVTFTPTAVGTGSGTLTVNDGASNSPQTVPLTGTGTVSGSTSVSLSSTSKNFGSVAVGSSISVNITLTNGTTPLTIANITTTGDYSETSTCPIAPQTLAANGTCIITVAFNPAVLGTLNGTLAVNDNASNSPQSATLTGTGVTPVVLSPTSLAMGSESENTTSASKAVTVKNNQPTPLTIASISTSANFGQTSSCPLSPNTLAPNTTCIISVTFTPTTAGTITGTLSVNDDASGSPQTVSLSGTGVAPVTISPTSLTFSSQLVTTTSTSQAITVKNNQSSAMTISGISASGDFAQTSTCPFSPSTLAAGTSCKISVTFTPSALGTRTGTLTITDNAGTSPQTASLTGTGSLTGLSAISITPVNPTVPLGSQVQLVASGTFPSKKILDISNVVTWSSFAPEYAPVGATGLSQAVALGTATITASYGSYTGQTSVTVGEPAVTSVTVMPASPSIAVGSYEQFVATLNYSDGSSKQQTTGVTWTSSSSNVAAISSSGLAGALSAGSTTIQASIGSLSGNTSLSTTQPACTAAPAGLIGWWTGDGNTVDIAGNNSGTLQNGAIYGNGEVGQAFQFGGNGASVLVNAPVYSPAAGTLMFWFSPGGGGTMTGSNLGGQNRAPGFWIDSGGNLNWEFGDLSAQPLGQLILNQWYHVALTYAGSSSAVNVNVYLDGALVASALADANAAWNSQVAFGAYLGTQQLSFTGSMDEIAIFNQALSAQQIQQIYGAYSGGMCKPTLQSIGVNPANPTIAPGLTQQFDAVGTYSDSSMHDVTSSATWSTTNAAVATINAAGLVTGVANGTSNVSAALGSANGSTGLTVGPTLASIQVNPPNPSAAAGTMQPFTATGTFTDGSQQDVTASVSWSSSLVSVASISSGGVATALSAGVTTISATLNSVTGSTTLTVTGAPALVSITISPANSTIQIGQNQQFTAIGTYTDGSQQNITQLVQWSSTASSVASIRATGVASALSGGTTAINASLSTIAASSTLNVSSLVLVSIAVTPASPAIAPGTNQQFTATGTYADGSTLNLSTSASWSSSSMSVATVSAQGLGTGLTTGQTMITATVAGVGGSDTLTVTSATLVSISVVPLSSTIPLGTTAQFDATGVFSDGTTQDVTTSVRWTSSEGSVASISNASGSQGLATSVAPGVTTISALSAGITGSATLTVSSTALVSITVGPANPSIALGTTQQFTATGTFTDGTQQNLTLSATWSSTNTAVATVSPAGLGTSTTVGTASITASLGTVSGSTLLTVTQAAVVSVTVSPSAAAVPAGIRQLFTAQAKFTDGTTQDVTASAHWSSSIPGVATISNSSGTNGLANTFGSGSTTVSAMLGSVSDSGSLTVTSAVLAAIQITPLSPIVPLDGTGQLNATGIYTDGSSANITGVVMWSSSAPAVAIVSNASGTQGLATGLATGSTIISATSGSLLDSTVMNVDDQIITINVGPTSAVVNPGGTQQFTATATYNSGVQLDLTNAVAWTSSNPSVASVSSAGLATSLASGQTIMTATLGSFTSSANLTVSQTLSVATPTHLRVDISDGTSGQLFVSWDSMQGATYYNLQRSTSATSGFSLVSTCSGSANIGNTQTNSGSMACRDGNLTTGTTYYYRVEACNANGCSTYSSSVSNVPITSDCTSTQMPNLSGVKILPPISVPSNIVDPTVQFLPNNNEYAGYAAQSVMRRNILVVELPGSGSTCDIGNFGQVAEKLGFDVICVNYSNAAEQINICTGDINCFGNVSQAKLDATGPCSVPSSPVCGIDPTTKQPYVNSNPADAVTQRVSMMLQYLNSNGYNQNGTNWGAYLSGTTPQWNSIIIGGFSQGGDMGTLAGYENLVSRVYNLSGPPQATPVNGVMTGAAYFTQMTPVTNIRSFYGLVSTNDPLYPDGDYYAVWAALGFTAANNDAEVKLNTSTPIGITCNAGTPSHNFSSSALVSPAGGHADTLYLWNEDVYKFLLID